MVGRLTCLSCGTLFNSFTNPPAIDTQCDYCGGTLHHRSDDNEETIDRRLRIYEMHTQPLSAYYNSKGNLHTIDGQGTVEDVRKRIKSALRGMRSSRIKLQPIAQQPAVKAASTRPQVIRTQVSDKQKAAPRQKKREAAAINPVVKKRKKPTLSKAEIAYRKQLKALQDELKSVKSELQQVMRAERKLVREVQRNEAQLEKLTQREASLK